MATVYPLVFRRSSVTVVMVVRQQLSVAMELKEIIQMEQEDAAEML